MSDALAAEPDVPDVDHDLELQRPPYRAAAGKRGYSIDKDDYLLRLRKIEGQVRGLQRMVDDDVYCIDIITQVGSITGALHRVALGLVDQHLHHCVMDAAADPGGDPVGKLTEATRAIERLLRV